MNYLYSGMVYILQLHSAAIAAVGWQLEQSFALFVSAHTGQGSKGATDFFNWQLTVISTGCLVRYYFPQRISATDKNRVTYFLIHSILCKTE